MKKLFNIISDLKYELIRLLATFFIANFILVYIPNELLKSIVQLVVNVVILLVFYFLNKDKIKQILSSEKEGVNVEIIVKSDYYDTAPFFRENILAGRYYYLFPKKMDVEVSSTLNTYKLESLTAFIKNNKNGIKLQPKVVPLVVEEEPQIISHDLSFSCTLNNIYKNFHVYPGKRNVPDRQYYILYLKLKAANTEIVSSIAVVVFFRSALPINTVSRVYDNSYRISLSTNGEWKFNVLHKKSKEINCSDWDFIKIMPLQFKDGKFLITNEIRDYIKVMPYVDDEIIYKSGLLPGFQNITHINEQLIKAGHNSKYANIVSLQQDIDNFNIHLKMIKADT